ncbi:hypothetical protein BO71DRAFT_243198 [Aspergillus ellipticus CBS 707.79]|uniref:Uncharacterized protein n=1 Tax=Aspergillus ellipticus CBS 707.79 TaxID=1448320 RepID=A0A319D967_9EURO|nr:hypothetical protein BO71DRAFT_243198 [Aspergillus ellipticus CBS 707.79]
MVTQEPALLPPHSNAACRPRTSRRQVGLLFSGLDRSQGVSLRTTHDLRSHGAPLQTPSQRSGHFHLAMTSMGFCSRSSVRPAPLSPPALGPRNLGDPVDWRYSVTLERIPTETDCHLWPPESHQSHLLPPTHGSSSPRPGGWAAHLTSFLPQAIHHTIRYRDARILDLLGKDLKVVRSVFQTNWGAAGKRGRSSADCSCTQFGMRSVIGQRQIIYPALGYEYPFGSAVPSISAPNRAGLDCCRLIPIDSLHIPRRR